jgi:pentatricopeptide repeat protein
MLLLFGVPLLSAAFAPTTTRPSSPTACSRRHSAESDDNASSSSSSLKNPSLLPLQDESNNNKNNNLSNNEDGMVETPQQSFFPRDQELTTTLSGGTGLMFKMIRSSLLAWKPPQEGINISKSSNTNNINNNNSNNNSNSNIGSINPNPADEALPRWRPYAGVADANTSFRTTAPSMNNEGFARSMWRDLRKRDKPRLWRNALRTYDRMSALEEEGAVLQGGAIGSTSNINKIRRSNIHHEGAMLACAKLGLWQRALEIYHYVYQKEQEIAERSKLQKAVTNKSVIRKQFAKSQKARTEKLRIRRGIKVSDDMIFSLVKACVRASFQRSRKHREQQSKLPCPESEAQEAALRRIPLDTALEVLRSMEVTHNIPVVAHYVNPLAKAYQSLGCVQEARNMLQTMLSNRTAGEEPEDGTDVVNVYDFSAKDKGSYSLLVQGSVVTGDWGAAVEALGEMIDAGLYPNKRHSNIWREISEHKTRPRAVGSWKKKRDDCWTDSVA